MTPAMRLAIVVATILIVSPLLAWVAAKALIVSAERGQADALVVLAGSSTYIERTRRAAQLYGDGRASMVLLTNDDQLSGWSRAQQRNPRFVDRAADALQRGGVPQDHIEIIPGVVTSTYEEAERLREYAVSHQLRSLLVVTSGYQSRRALWTFRRVFSGTGIEIGIDPIPPGIQTPGPATWWLHPFGWRVVIGEYAKMIYYVARY
jgi:uncharacterized SAM-binding protein YcdF (DUF218 family)